MPKRRVSSVRDFTVGAWRHLIAIANDLVNNDAARRKLVASQWLEHIPFLRNRDMLYIHSLAHVLVGEPMSTPGSSPGAGFRRDMR